MESYPVNDVLNSDSVTHRSNGTFINRHNNVAGVSMLRVKSHRQFLKSKHVMKYEVMKAVQSRQLVSSQHDFTYNAKCYSDLARTCEHWKFWYLQTNQQPIN